MAKQVHVGKVISDKMDKTVVAQVERTFNHPVFHKVVRTVKKYKVHDEEKKARVGDTIEFYLGRPKSKTKHMYLARVIKSGTEV